MPNSSLNLDRSTQGSGRKSQNDAIIETSNPNLYIQSTSDILNKNNCDISNVSNVNNINNSTTLYDPLIESESSNDLAIMEEKSLAVLAKPSRVHSPILEVERIDDESIDMASNCVESGFESDSTEITKSTGPYVEKQSFQASDIGDIPDGSVEIVGQGRSQSVPDDAGFHRRSVLEHDSLRRRSVLDENSLRRRKIGDDNSLQRRSVYADSQNKDVKTSISELEQSVSQLISNVGNSIGNILLEGGQSEDDFFLSIPEEGSDQSSPREVTKEPVKTSADHFISGLFRPIIEECSEENSSTDGNTTVYRRTEEVLDPVVDMICDTLPSVSSTLIKLVMSVNLNDSQVSPLSNRIS